MSTSFPSSWKTSAKRTLILVLDFGIPLGVMGVVLPLLLSTQQSGATLSSSLCGPPSGSIESFFSPDATFGNFTVSQARAIDISWNLLMGKGLQGFIGIASYQTVIRSFARIVETTPVSYALFETLVFSPNGFSALKALTIFLTWSSGRRFPLTLGFLFFSTAFIMTLPTVMDISTGYVQNVQPYWQFTNGSLELATSNQPPPSAILSVEYMVQNGYQWGFSSPWILTLSSIFLLWVIGMCGIWADANQSSEMHQSGIGLGKWKAIIDLGKAMDFQLGDHIADLSNEEIAKRVATSSPIRYVKTIDRGNGSKHFRLMPALPEPGHRKTGSSFDLSETFMPKTLLGIRVLQLAVAIIELGLSSLLIAHTTGGVFGPVIFATFCSVVTVMVAGYTITERFKTPSCIFWIVLALDVILSIFWLSSLTALAVLKSAFHDVADIVLRKRYDFEIASETWLVAQDVAIAMAATQIILFIASAVMSSIRLHRIRNSYTRLNNDEIDITLLRKSSTQKSHISSYSIDVGNHETQT